MEDATLEYGASTRLNIPKTAIMVVLIVAAVVAVFWPVCGHEFVDWDDPYTVGVRNQYFNPPGLRTLGWCWREPYLHLYIPMTYTVWTGVAQIAMLAIPGEHGIALDPYPFHATNLMAHAISALLVFAILRLLVANDWGAFLARLLFALHPVQVEPVAWISGFKDMLCGTLSLAAIWQYLLYATRRQGGTEAAEWRVPFILATIFFLFAMLAKPSALTVPLIVGTIDLLLLRRKWDEVSGPLWIWLMLALFFLVIGRMAQPATGLDFVAPLTARPFLATFAIAFDIAHLFVPIKFAPDYGLSPDRLLAWPLWPITYFAWILPASLAALCWVLRRRAPWLVAAAAVFALALLPVLGLLPFDFQYYSTVADRYLYVAMLGPAMVLAYVASRYFTTWFLVPVAAVLVCCGAITFHQTWFWRDTQTLFTHTLEVNPRSFVGHMMMGVMHERSNNIPGAVAEFNLAFQTKPNDSHVHYNIANILCDQDRVVESIGHYDRAVKQQPDEPDFHLRYGLALIKLGRLEEAIAQFTASRRADPNYTAATAYLATTETMLGRRYLEQQNWAAAMTHFRAALEADPGLAPAQSGLTEARRRLGVRTVSP